MSFIVNFFSNFLQLFRNNIASEFTRESIRVQKELALQLEREFVQDIYLYDKCAYFDEAYHRMFNGVRYLSKNDKKAVLLMAGQETMRSAGEYFQFNMNTTDVDTDSIGVYLLYEIVFLRTGLIADLRKCRYCQPEVDLPARIDKMREIIKQYDKSREDKSESDSSESQEEGQTKQNGQTQTVFQKCVSDLDNLIFHNKE